MDRVSIYDVAGGAPAMLRLADVTNRRYLEDPVLNHPFSHTSNPDHVQRLAEYWGEVLGGPAVYSQSYGGHSAMLEIHARTGADDEFADRFVDCFVRAADDADLPADPELRSCLRSYMEWATAEVMSYSPRDAAVPDDLAVPRWSWDGLKA